MIQNVLHSHGQHRATARVTLMALGVAAIVTAAAFVPVIGQLIGVAMMVLMVVTMGPLILTSIESLVSSPAAPMAPSSDAWGAHSHLWAGALDRSAEPSGPGLVDGWEWEAAWTR
jgi:hypothetical protein